MPKSTTFASDVLATTLQAGASSSGVITGTGGANLYLALHTATISAGSVQNGAEIAYTGYSRVAVARASGFSGSGASRTLAANQDFGEMTGGVGGTATYASLGVTSSGAGAILYYGALSPSLSVVTGTIPRIKSTSSFTES